MPGGPCAELAEAVLHGSVPTEHVVKRAADAHPREGIVMRDVRRGISAVRKVARDALLTVLRADDCRTTLRTQHPTGPDRRLASRRSPDTPRGAERARARGVRAPEPLREDRDRRSPYCHELDHCGLG